MCNWSYTLRSFCLPNLPGHRRRGEWWPVPGVGHALHSIFWLLLDLICLTLSRARGGLIKGRNSVHLQACAAKNFPNFSCIIDCSINRCTYIRLPTCRSRLCLVACRGICRGDVATGGPLKAGSLKIRQIYINNMIKNVLRSTYSASTQAGNRGSYIKKSVAPSSFILTSCISCSCPSVSLVQVQQAQTKLRWSKENTKQGSLRK